MVASDLPGITPECQCLCKHCSDLVRASLVYVKLARDGISIREQICIGCIMVLWLEGLISQWKRA